MTLQDGLLFAVLPAAVGSAVALALLLMARSELRLPQEQQGQAIVLFALPLTPVILAFVGANAAAQSADAEIPLLVLGAAGFLCAAAQGYLGSRSMKTLTGDPQAFGRALIPLAAVETLPILAFVWVMMGAGTGV